MYEQLCGQLDGQLNGQLHGQIFPFLYWSDGRPVSLSRELSESYKRYLLLPRQVLP